jgi:uncharacterized membrane protein YeaQ/YmgE (transglycosylase-associated protein family)
VQPFTIFIKTFFMPEIVWIIIIGAIAGWIAGALVNSDGGSFLLDVVIGIVGGYIGYRLFGEKLSITSSLFVNKIITSTAGAVVLALGVKLIRRATS